MIPEEFTRYCKWNTVEYCPYLIHSDCPETCGYARDILGASKLLSRDQLEKILKDNLGDED